ncbi:MAG TPA: FmdB family zinc ribbon protein [Acidimicrobiales bacterium]|nr:FmdB family zinc ribbon protein [Acidimicrobiales bacterium]
MPTYEYACRSCGQHVEVVQSFSDAPLTECPHCGGELRKVFGSIGIAFKGSGFYKTDSRNSSGGSRSAEPAPSAGGSSSTESASSGTSSDSKSSDAKSSDAKKPETKSSDSKSSSSSVGAAAS